MKLTSDEQASQNQESEAEALVGLDQIFATSAMQSPALDSTAPSPFEPDHEIGVLHDAIALIAACSVSEDLAQKARSETLAYKALAASALNLAKGLWGLIITRVDDTGESLSAYDAVARMNAEATLIGTGTSRNDFFDAISSASRMATVEWAMSIEFVEPKPEASLRHLANAAGQFAGIAMLSASSTQPLERRSERNEDPAQ